MRGTGISFDSDHLPAWYIKKRGLLSRALLFFEQESVQCATRREWLLAVARVHRCEGEVLAWADGLFALEFFVASELGLLF